MTPERRAKLEAAGHKVQSAEDFFGLDEADRRVVGLRLHVAREVRRLREEQGLTQSELADRIKVSQSRITGIEKGQKASFDAILTAYVVLGGGLPDFGINATTRPRRHRRHPSRFGMPRRPGGISANKRTKQSPKPDPAGIV